jgi:hypothetical protein
MPAHMKGNEGNLPFRTEIESFRMPGPLDGAPKVPTAVHPLCRFVPHSGCFGRLCPGSTGFAFEPYALADPTTISRPILDTVGVSHDVKGVSYEESDDM